MWKLKVPSFYDSGKVEKWYGTHDIWHMTHDRWCLSLSYIPLENIKLFGEFQSFISSVKVPHFCWNYIYTVIWANQWIKDEDISRTVSATQDLLTSDKWQMTRDRWPFINPMLHIFWIPCEARITPKSTLVSNSFIPCNSMLARHEEEKCTRPDGCVERLWKSLFLIIGLSCVTCHVSCVTCHLASVTCPVSHFFLYELLKIVGGGSVINGTYPV